MSYGKHAAVGSVIAALVFAVAGALVASADNRGSVRLTNGKVSFSGTYAYDVYWNSWSTGVAVKGTLRASGSDNGYLNGTQQGYGWTRHAWANKGTTVSVNKVIGPGDTRKADNLGLSVCTARWYWDSCTERRYPR